MHATPLFLSHWDASIPISVPPEVVEDLKNYHIMGVRFLYECFQKGQKGVILNHEHGMNFQIQVSAFLNALSSFITPESPVLIVCPEESLNVWHYHLTNHGGIDVTLLSVRNYEEIVHSEVHRVILASIDNAKLLREIKEVDFFSLVVEQLDIVATKMIVKQLKSRFNIGLTNRNFLKQPDQKLFWTMFNWSNPGVLGKFAEFCIEDDNHLQNLRYPYGDWWDRLTWRFCETFKTPTNDEQMQYKKRLQKWSARHTFSYNDMPKSENKRQTRKRKAAQENPIKSDPDKQEQDEDLQHFIAEDDIKLEPGSTKNLLNTENPSLKLNSSFGNLNSSNKNNSQNFINSQNLNSSQETVIYDLSDNEVDDNNSILTSIMGGFGKPKLSKMSEFESDVKEEKQSLSKDDVFSMLFEPKAEANMDDDENDILTSIIKSNSANTQGTDSQNFLENNSPNNIFENGQNSDCRSTSPKNEILSLLFGATPN